MEKLIETKTVTINKLMQLVPAGTPDPSPYLYNSTMYAMSGIMALACLSHYLVRPVDPKWHEKE